MKIDMEEFNLIKGFERSSEIARHVYNAIKGRTDEEIKVLNVTEITTISDIFVIVTANSTRAVAGLCDEVEAKLEEQGFEKVAREGYDSARWILLDYNGVMVHIFYKEEAEFYNLDKLWSDGEIMDLD